ncbi:MAG: ATP-binding cassette domain-containing protein [Gemmatimonadaceae bacterium]
MSRAPLALSARDVTCRYGDLVAVRAVSLEVEPGAAVALIGESGSGKTTLLRCFNHMVTPDRGLIFVDGVDISTEPIAELRRRIGYVPQHGGLLPHWRVLRNVALVPALLGDTSAHDAAVAALTLVGLAPDRFANRFPHELSGGQRQRVALARALAARPGVILLDEPFGALDAITRSDVQASFAEMRGSLGVTTLLVTHDLAEAARLASEIVVMREGRIEQRGTLSDLQRTPATPYVTMLVERAVATASSLGGS